MEIDQENNEEINAVSILSVCWDNGKVAAVVYNLTTLELNVSLFKLKP
jgi:hypothetical protein